MRAYKIMTDLNIALSSLQTYARQLGKEIETANDKVPSELAEMIKRLHGGEIEPLINLDDLIPSKDLWDMQVVSDLPVEFKKPNPSADQVINLIKQQDIFESRSLKLLKLSGQEVPSKFTHDEAFHICRGMRKRGLTRKANLFFRNPQVVNEEHALEAHITAMEQLERGGGKSVSYLLTLEPLPIKVLQTEKIFTFLDKQRRRSPSPVVYLRYTNIQGGTENLKLYFFQVEDKHYRNLASVRRDSDNQLMMKISRHGIVVPESGVPGIIPMIRFFMKYSQSPGDKAFYYSVEPGECRVCHRTLTDEVSIKRGIGPVCSRH